MVLKWLLLNQIFKLELEVDKLGWLDVIVNRCLFDGMLVFVEIIFR